MQPRDPHSHMAAIGWTKKQPIERNVLSRALSPHRSLLYHTHRLHSLLLLAHLWEECEFTTFTLSISGRYKSVLVSFK